MKQLSYIFADLSPLKNTRKYAGFCRAIFSTLACCVKTKGQNKDQTKTRESGPGKPLEAVTRPDLFAKKGRPRGFFPSKRLFAVMRFASIAFVKHFVKHTVYKRSRQGSTPDPHRNQKSGSPCPITPPELEIPSRLPGRAAPNGAHRAPAPPSKAVSDRPAFFSMGGKVKQKPHFFHPKIGGILRGRRATRRFFPGRTREFLGAPSLFRL